MDYCSLRPFFVGREEKLQSRGKWSRLLFTPDLRGYWCCGRRGLCHGAVRLPIVALVVESRPAACSVKVIVGVCDNFAQWNNELYKRLSVSALAPCSRTGENSGNEEHRTPRGATNERTTA